MYTTRENALRAYQAYLAQEGKKAADMNKVSFDFDGTISKAKWQEKAMMLIEDGKTVYIVTRRQIGDGAEVYKVADK
ncbi:hypothetical protein EBT25_14085, partial [bacterium]|nr:hypothetical protein [bacterium]